jgi:aminoglycoside phosphotransferase (APT) family kinase protein
MGRIMIKRTYKEIWQTLEVQAIEDEIEAVLAMTPEERRRELFAAGFDLLDVRARADALGAAHPSSETLAVRAATLRREARDAYDTKAWAACLEKLNEAQALDPEGDNDPDVQALRRRAEGAHP